MAILQCLSAVALEQVLGQGAVGLLDLFTNHLADRGQNVLRSLRTANDRAWKALEIALAGDSWWDRAKARLANAEDRAFGEQVRAFLDGLPLPEMENRAVFRQRCLIELREARDKNLLTGGMLDPAALARQVGDFVRAAPQAILDVQWKALQSAADQLRLSGHTNLAWLVAQRPQAGTPLLVLAVRYFFRREVETDPQLARGLTFTTLDQLTRSQEAGLDRLHDLLTRQASWLEGLLGGIWEVTQDTNARVRELEKQIGQVLDQLQMRGRELSPRDSLSIRTEKERQLVKALLAKVRQVPEAELRASPGLLNEVGKVQVAVGEYQGARETFGRAAAAAPDDAARGEAHYNAYRAALEQRDWDDALQELIQAVRIDSRRFAPFPVGRYTPQRIIGAGGFGVAFLCQHRHLQVPLVVKALLADDLDRDADNVFSEAQLLTQLDDPAFVRASDCGYADAAHKSRPYLVMDYFDGVSLEEYVRRNGPLALADMKQIALPVARGLQAAHGKGILHRDVKPANLLVRQDPGEWRVKLIDFGLALKRAVLENTVHSRGAWDNTLASSSIAGTLDYAAPEQMGKLPGVAIGPHSDVYGFGKSCYFALVGTPDPDDRQKAALPIAWRRFLGDCTAHPDNRLPDFGAVLRRLSRLRVPKPGGKASRPPAGEYQEEVESDEQAEAPALPPPAPGTFHVLCPHCRRHLAAQEAQAGLTVRCAACAGTFTVPPRPGQSPAPRNGLNTPPPGKGVSTDPAPFQVGCPHCQQRLSVMPTQFGQTLRCPRCSGEFTLRSVG